MHAPFAQQQEQPRFANSGSSARAECSGRRDPTPRATGTPTCPVSVGPRRLEVQRAAFRPARRVSGGGTGRVSLEPAPHFVFVELLAPQQSANTCRCMRHASSVIRSPATAAKNSSASWAQSAAMSRVSLNGTGAGRESKEHTLGLSVGSPTRSVRRPWSRGPPGSRDRAPHERWRR